MLLYFWHLIKVTYLTGQKYPGLLWHMVGQGPAVLGADAGWVGYVFFYLVYFYFLLFFLISSILSLWVVRSGASSAEASYYCGIWKGRGLQQVRDGWAIFFFFLHC